MQDVAVSETFILGKRISLKTLFEKLFLTFPSVMGKVCNDITKPLPCISKASDVGFTAM